ncbi:MAG: hypothetical protein VX344_04995 [Bacteroidota bacterium]|nr:hypothetical protein [Bacteroidota bacterium]
MFRLIFPFILDILFFDVFSSTGLILISTCLFVCAFFSSFFIKSHNGLWWYGLVVAILLFYLSGYATHYSITSNEKHSFEKYLEENCVLLLKLSHEPILGLNSKRFFAKVLSVDRKQTSQF